MPLTLLVPDLLPPARAPGETAELRLPALEVWLARADARREAGRGSGWLLGQWGLAGDAPVAALTLAADGGPRDGAWLRADPGAPARRGARPRPARRLGARSRASSTDSHFHRYSPVWQNTAMNDVFRRDRMRYREIKFLSYIGNVRQHRYEHRIGILCRNAYNLKRR